MADPNYEEGAFPFTEDEMVEAFVLVEDPTTARQHARAAASALAPPGMDWAMSGPTLLLLYLGSASARAKIDVLRARGTIQDAPGQPSWDERVNALREDLDRRKQTPPGTQ
jgi:hypothetical protein